VNGAEALIRTLLGGGVDVCFTNPGTSEMHLVAALDRLKEMRCVLGLFEGVATGAADGYARMAGKPACTLLHLGPGLANGLANLHNASRAMVPILNLVGQHATYHLRQDAPLTSDIEGIARPYSKWLRSSCAASELGNDAADAVVAARTAPGRIATLIVPANAAWGEGGAVVPIPELPAAQVPARETIEQASKALRSGLRTAILLSGRALYGSGLHAAGRIAAATHAKLFAPYPFTRMERGAGRPAVERIAYIFEQALEQLKEFKQLILVGSPAPVSYFASPGKNSVPVAQDATVFALSTPEQDSVAALESLSDALSIKGVALREEQASRPALPTGKMSLPGLAASVAALLPAEAIVVDESMTSGREFMPATKGAPPHDWLANTGGSIGIALPLAVGAAVARPQQRVLCLSADGSGMYTLQALWTMAREGLKITTVIFANRAYSVLRREFSYLGIGEPGPRAASLFDIGRPDLDWVSLAKGLGVPASRADTLDDFVSALHSGFEAEGPTLIEVPL
jgi:acetolactate synthase I/II/III large subunit